jgi:hypothetical protein
MPVLEGIFARDRGPRTAGATGLWQRLSGIDAACVVVLALAAMVLFATAPKQGDFWWSDASRHALNGVFVRDLLGDLPLSDPVGYATQYYLRYPALTVLFYPPLFYLLSAPFFALFGVSHAVAMVPESLACLGFALGCFAVYRRWVGRAAALAGALLLMSAPIVALWGRQVMLDIPCYAFLIWSVWFWFRYADTGQPRSLYGAAFLFLCALYTKQTVAFVALPIAVLLLLYRGRAVLRDRHAWLALTLFVIGLAPLALMSWKFGQANAQSVAGIDDAIVSRSSLEGWVWYLRGLPHQLGWPTTILAAIGLVGTIAWKRFRIDWRDAVFLALWFATGYLMFSAIDLKDLRFTIFILFPVVTLALLPLDRLAVDRVAPFATVALGIAVLSANLIANPVPRIEGYRSAVDVIADRAPRGSTVLFSGYRDGNFIFGMRARTDRRDLRVLRADKLLLKFSIRRELGVEEKGYSEDEIADLLNGYGVAYVVAQSDFWTDLAEMRRLQAVLRSSRFEEVVRVPITGNVPHDDRELVIYRNRGPVAPPGAAIQLDLPIIGRRIEGKLQ